jgi:hypothetical protein
MLDWNHESRASAHDMLKHPWLNMQDNYEFKYTDREYEVMMLKKDLKNQMKGTTGSQPDEAVPEERQEMNELIESEPELYAADTEEVWPKKKKQQPSRERFKEEILNQLKSGDTTTGVLGSKAAEDDAIFKEIIVDDEISLEDPWDEREMMKNRKEFETKIHNSFTGPYPLDPTEFGHTDKGENYQFSTVEKGGYGF